MKGIFQKYGLLICLIGSVAILSGGGIYLQKAKDKNVITLVDLSGIAGAWLDGFTVHGYLGDDYHCQEITIENGKLNRKFIPQSIDSQQKFEPIDGFFLYAPAKGVEVTTNITPMEDPQTEFAEFSNVQPTDEGTLISVESMAVDLYVQIINWDIKGVQNEGRFRTGIQKVSKDKPFAIKNKILEGSTIIIDPVGAGGDSPDDVELVAATVNGKQYFTIKVNKGYRGMNGIYRIESYEDGNLFDDDGDSEVDKFIGELLNMQEFGKAVRIAEIPLDEETQVFDLKSVGDSLVIIKGENSRVILEMYNLQGKLQDSLTLPESIKSDTIAEIETYCNDINGQNSISLRVWYQVAGDEHSMEAGAFASIVAKDTLQLNYFIEGLGDLENAAQYHGRLLLLSKDVGYVHPSIWETQYEVLYLTLLEPTSNLKGKVVYRGQLITDIGDDQKKKLGAYKQNHTVFVNSVDGFRRFGEFSIKGGAGND